MKVKVAAVALVAALSAAAFEKPTLFNGGFETVDATGHASDWNYPKGSFKVDPAGGMNGTKALCFSGSATDYKASIQQRVLVVPGVRYDFGCMIRTEKLEGEGMGARICVQFEDQYGRYIDGQYNAARAKGTKAWMRSSARTMPAPPKSYWATVRVEVIGPCTGKAAFDDVFFTCRDRQAVECLFCDCYRDEAVDGEVTFGAGINATALKADGKPYACRFVFTDADGARQTVKPDVRTSEKALVTLPVARLALGPSPVACVITDARGKEVGRQQMTFTRLKERVSRRVAFDRRGRCLVDGKPFFPLGMYWSVAKPYHTFKLPEIDEAGVKTFADSPFNCTMAYKAPSREQLDILHRHGIKSIYCIASKFGGDWDPSGKDPARRHAPDAAKRIAEVRDHPAVLAWYLQDERPISMKEELVARRRTANELDPDHPTWICVYQFADTQEYYQTTDVMGTDPYPIAGSPLSLAYKWSSAVRDASFGLKPFWQVPQAFDWATFRKTNRDDRMPTEAEMTNMAWQNIAGGANGLVFYSFTYLYQCKSTPFEKAWADTRAAAQTVRDRFDMLLSDGTPPTFTVSNDQVVARTWRQGRKVWVLAVNTTQEPQQATVRLEGGKSLDFALKALEHKIVDLSD